MYMSELDGTTDYTYKKSEGSYNTEEPMYDIYADDKKVARMTLEAKDQHVVLGILTVFDWKVKSIEPDALYILISGLLTNPVSLYSTDFGIVTYLETFTKSGFSITLPVL